MGVGGDDKSWTKANGGRESELPVELQSPWKLLGSCCCSCGKLKGNTKGNLRTNRCETSRTARHTVVSDKHVMCLTPVEVAC